MRTIQEKLERVQDFRPIDDVFFEALAQNREVCQEILRVIMEDKELIVESVITQCSENNLYGRSVRLDALCTLRNGTKCNIDYSDFCIIPINQFEGINLLLRNQFYRNKYFCQLA